MSTYVIDGNILISYSGEEEIINIPSGIFSKSARMLLLETNGQRKLLLATA